MCSGNDALPEGLSRTFQLEQKNWMGLSSAVLVNECWLDVIGWTDVYVVKKKKKDNNTLAGVIDGLLAKTHIIKHCLFGMKFVFGQISNRLTDGEAN